MAERGLAPPARANQVAVRGVRVPVLIYGTAWKEERTAALTRQALDAGFRGVDTANQRRHYHEAGAGEALRAFLDAGSARREELFVQTKFTYRRGQDHRLPYDPAAPLAAQVDQSLASSLDHLGVDYVDAYLLHGPSTFPGLAEADWQTWRAMEEAHESGRARLLGVSNVGLEQLEELHSKARVPPVIVQNRCFTRPHADRAVRGYCSAHGIAYQGFSLLTAVPWLLAHPTVRGIMERTGRTAAQVVFRYALDAGMLVLTGTTSAEHMRQDLDVLEFGLQPAEVEAVKGLTG